MNLHQGEALLVTGAPLARARGAVVALHGRGASAEGVVSFVVDEIDGGEIAFVAPQARGASWYPRSFLAPFEQNEPWLSSALARVSEVLSAVERGGVPRERILLFGFSQGACLASEALARNPGRYAGLVAATGGRIGPPGTRFAPTGDLAGTPVHLSAGDPDPHVPWSRVEESAASFAAMNAIVTMHRDPGFPHAVHPTALLFARERLAEL